MRVEAKLLVVGIDGLRWDRVADAGASRLLALRDRGVFAPSLIPLEYSAETVSGPGWSTIVTGVWPAKHGVRDNDFVGKRYDGTPTFSPGWHGPDSPPWPWSTGRPWPTRASSRPRWSTSSPEMGKHMDTSSRIVG